MLMAEDTALSQQVRYVLDKGNYWARNKETFLPASIDTILLIENCKHFQD